MSGQKMVSPPNLKPMMKNVTTENFNKNKPQPSILPPIEQEFDNFKIREAGQLLQADLMKQNTLTNILHPKSPLSDDEKPQPQ